MPHNQIDRALSDRIAVLPEALAMPVAVTIANATRLSGLSRSEVYRLLAASKLQAVKSGRSTLVLMESVRAHVVSLPPAIFRSPRS